MKDRNRLIADSKNKYFDTVIIGGGINGAVSFASLAARGAKVLLVDMADFASHTSQETSNLVWGGIKYLENYELRLVRGLCKSRNRLLKAYPTALHEVRFLTIHNFRFRFSRLMLWLGTWLYWFLGMFFTKRPRLFSKKSIARHEPEVNLVNSDGGFEYSDACVLDNDARFTFSFIKRGLTAGGTALNYVKCRGVRRDSDGRWQVKLSDGIRTQGFKVFADVIINAAGPFSDKFNAQNRIRTTYQHVLSKGIHLITRKISAHKEKVLTFFADDGRMFFVIPMGGRSCLGTTDTRVNTPEPHVINYDRIFILDNINKLFKLETPLRREDIISERCGVRPLAVKREHRDTKADWTSLSRKHVIECDNKNKYISIYGGKLTDCLNVGEEIAAKVRQLGVEGIRSSVRWYGEDPSSSRRRFYREARKLGLHKIISSGRQEKLHLRLWRRYGEGAFSILKRINKDRGMLKEMFPESGLIKGELAWIRDEEMVVNLEDFFRRRTMVGLVNSRRDLISHSNTRFVSRVLFGRLGDKKLAEFRRKKQK